MPESINFSPYYALRKISDLKIEGSFNNSWSGKYHRVSRNKVTIFEPIIGSGLVVRTTELNNGKLLDDELSKIISRSGIIYTIISNYFLYHEVI